MVFLIGRNHQMIFNFLNGTWRQVEGMVNVFLKSRKYKDIIVLVAWVGGLAVVYHIQKRRGRFVKFTYKVYSTFGKNKDGGIVEVVVSANGPVLQGLYCWWETY